MKNIAGTTRTAPQIKDSIVHDMICNNFITGGVQEWKVTEMGPKKRSKAICFGKQKRAEINKLSVKSQEINTLGFWGMYSLT